MCIRDRMRIVFRVEEQEDCAAKSNTRNPFSESAAPGILRQGEERAKDHEDAGTPEGRRGELGVVPGCARCCVRPERARYTASGDCGARPKFQHKKPKFQNNLCQECVFLSLISGCIASVSARTGRQAAGADQEL
eukprot:3871302-Rhodomonas_salina.2